MRQQNNIIRSNTLKLLSLNLIVIFCFFGCKKNPDAIMIKNQQLVDDKTIYEFLNSCIASDTTFFKNRALIDRNSLPIFRNKTDSLTIINADTLFSKKDVDFIFKQARFNTRFKIDKNKLPIKKIVICLDEKKAFGENSDDYYYKLREKYGTLSFATMPLFSVDRKTAIISLSYNCGSLCGYGATYIYKKVNGIWIPIAKWNELIS